MLLSVPGLLAGTGGFPCGKKAGDKDSFYRPALRGYPGGISGGQGAAEGGGGEEQLQ